MQPKKRKKKLIAKAKTTPKPHKASPGELKARKLLLELNPSLVPESEYRFHPTRRWRFDLAYPDQKIAFEIEGGTWTGGRHIHPLGFKNDCIKYNEAAKMGWKVYRLVPDMIHIEYLSDLLMNS